MPSVTGSLAHSGREHLLTPLDLALLRAISDVGSLAQACRKIGIGRDRGVYRIRRLELLLGTPVVRAERGGTSGGGGSELTKTGASLLRQGVGPLDREGEGEGPGEVAPLPDPLVGRWHAAPAPCVELDNGLRLFVGFRRPEGDLVGISVNPDAVVVARRRFPSSAQNVLLSRVLSLAPLSESRVLLTAEVRGVRLSSCITPQARRSLGLRKASRVYLYVKANAVRPVSGASARPTDLPTPAAAPLRGVRVRGRE